MESLNWEGTPPTKKKKWLENVEWKTTKNIEDVKKKKKKDYKERKKERKKEERPSGGGRRV